MVPYHEEIDRTKLRELRLWHWNIVIHNRTEAQERRILNHMLAERQHNELADQHMKFVQTLNNFFPVDDTAEKDAMK